MRKKLTLGKIILSFLILLLLSSCEESINDLQTDKNETFVVEYNVVEQIANVIDLDKLAGLNLKTKTKREIKKVDVVYSDEGIADFYIVNFEKEMGFIIISADKRIMPILAYSDKSNFELENTESGVSLWISNNKNYAKAIRKGEVTPKEEAKDLWNLYMRIEPVDEEPGEPGDPSDPNEGGGSTTPTLISSVFKGPLLLTRWGQRCGYNDFCPRSTNWELCRHCPTGCAATAIAQVMMYYKYPVSYDWNSMELLLGTTETAQLMWDIGDTIGMDYFYNGSGIDDYEFENNVEMAFENVFGYNSSVRYVEYNNYNILINELNANRPVIMGGKQSNGMGHIWVCDGYFKNVYTTFTNLFFYMNWGWDGLNDGYFAPNHFDPGSANYSQDLGCIIGIKP